MILCLDIGNSHIFGGVFDKDDLKLTFRKASKSGARSGHCNRHVQCGS